MKKYCLFLLLLVIGVAGSAQVHDFYYYRPVHKFGFSVEAGLAASPTQMEGGTPVASSLGFGGGLALFYELQYQHLLFRTGLGMDYSMWKQHLVPQAYDAPVQEYTSMTLHYDLSDVCEKQTYPVGYVPVMLGGTFNGFYFLAGTKIGLLSFATNAHTSAHNTTWASDEDIIDPMYDMNTHQLTDYDVVNKQKIRFNNLNIIGAVEMGVDLDRWLIKQPKRIRRNYYKKKPEELRHIKVSLFCDYGFSNLHNYQANAVPWNDGGAVMPEGGMLRFDDVKDVGIGSWTGFQPYKDCKINNMLVGVKFAMLFELPTKKPKRKPNNYAPIITYVKDSVTSRPIFGANVVITNTDNNKVSNRVSDSKNGRVFSKLAPGNYTIEVSKSGYMPAPPITVAQHEDDNDTIIARLSPVRPEPKQQVDTVPPAFDASIVEEGKRFVLQDMFFATNQTTILPSSEKSLMELYSFLKDNPEVNIRIIGHTDDVGSDAANQILSEGRANSIKREMVNRGIAPERIQTVGRGEKEPIAPNDSDEHRQMNRRVEVEIVEK